MDPAAKRLKDSVYSSGWKPVEHLDFAWERLLLACPGFEAVSLLKDHDAGLPVDRAKLLKAYRRDLATAAVLDRVCHRAAVLLRTRTRDNALEHLLWPELVGSAVAHFRAKASILRHFGPGELLLRSSDLLRGGALGSVGLVHRWREVEATAAVLVASELERDQRLLELLVRAWRLGASQLVMVLAQGPLMEGLLGLPGPADGPARPLPGRPGGFTP